jgi:hypothetical protein
MKMKALLLTIAIVALLFGLGWLSFASHDGKASVTVDTNRVKDDTSTAVEKGKEIVEEGIDKLKSKSNDDVAPTKEVSESELEPADTSNP